MSGLTPEQTSEVVQALYARLSETRRYLRSATSFTAGHADCCDVARARVAALAEQRRGLEQREEAVLSALQVFDPDDEDGAR